MSKEITNTLFSTIYFSDFFIKFEKIIKGNEDVFNDKEFKKLFFEKVKREFNYSNEEDFYDLKVHDK